MKRMSLVVMGLLGAFNLAQGQANGFCNLVWNDEFNAATLSSAWTREATCNGGGNNELECYTARDKNVFIDNGNLVLRAYRETYTGGWAGCTDSSGCTNTQPYTSGRVNTANSASWLYGRFETRAKLPKGIQLWPAIWMLPTDWKYGGWAASGEIDIMEARGNNPGVASGTLHHGGAWPQNIYTTTGDHGVGVDLSADFHVYTLEWTKDSLTWYIDNTQTQQISLNRWFNSTARNVYSAMGQPFDQRFHFILNLAVGGGFFGTDAPITDAQSAAWTQPELRIDYVRVWQQGGNCAATTSRSSQPTQAADANARPTTQASTPGLCNGQSYDSSRYTCATNEAGRQVLCSGVGTMACGTACYSPSQYCCYNGNLQVAGSCPAVTSAAATSTSTSAAVATSAPLSNNAQSGSCNGQGYDASAYTCTVNEQGHQVLCGIGGSSCGSACYNPSQYCCSATAGSAGSLVAKALCPTVVVSSTSTKASTTKAAANPTHAASNSCNGQNFDPSVYTCTVNDQGANILCLSGQQSCGGACYNSSFYCCKNGGLHQNGQC